MMKRFTFLLTLLLFFTTNLCAQDNTEFTVNYGSYILKYQPTSETECTLLGFSPNPTSEIELSIPEKVIYNELNYVDNNTLKFERGTLGLARMDYTYCTQNQLKESNLAFNYEVIQIESDVCGDSKNGLVYSMPTAKLSRDDTPSYGIRITNNKFYRVVRAIGNHSTRSTNYQRQVLIQGNTFDTILGDTIKLPKYKDISIKENYFKAISSTYVGGQRIRVIKCVNKNGKAYTDMVSSAKKLWSSQNYYMSSDGNYYLISKNKNVDNYKIAIQ